MFGPYDYRHEVKLTFVSKEEAAKNKLNPELASLLRVGWYAEFYDEKYLFLTNRSQTVAEKMIAKTIKMNNDHPSTREKYVFLRNMFA